MLGSWSTFRLVFHPQISKIRRGGIHIFTNKDYMEKQETNTLAFDPSTKLTKEEINTFPLFSFTGPVYVISSKEELHQAIPILNKETIIGFDTETKPTFKKGENNLPALLQLATRNEVYLLQLHKLMLTDEIKDILENPRLVKAGVALDQDIKALKQLSSFDSKGFVDLGKRAQIHNLPHCGLRGLTGLLLGVRISKQAQVSNWSRTRLFPKQISYAATDAWVSRELYFSFKEHGWLSAISS